MEKEESVIKDEIIGFLHNSLLNSLLTDICIQEHKIVSLRRIKLLGIGGSGSNNNGNFLATPKILINVASSGNTSRSSSPGAGGKKDTSALCDCLNCGRQIAFSRYASHLSQCMDLKNGSRSRRTPGGFPATNGLKKSNSPLPSDDDNGDRNKNIVKLTSSKRAGSPVGVASAAALASLKFKKLKPNPSPGSSPNPTSHPLAKSISLPPSAPTVSTSIAATSVEMSIRTSLPHSLPSPRPQSYNHSPSQAVPIKPFSPTNGNSQTLPKNIPPSSQGTTNSDRPESDSSEDDSPEVLKKKAAAARSRNNATTKGSQAIGLGSSAVKRGVHPLAKGIDDSASEKSDSDGSSD